MRGWESAGCDGLPSSEGVSEQGRSFFSFRWQAQFEALAACLPASMEMIRLPADENPQVGQL